MTRRFEKQDLYRGPLISRIKRARQEKDPRKRDLSPTVLDFGPVSFVLARHFGFCYGVENAIEIAYKTLEANPGRRIYFLSEMIHNPRVNGDLKKRGVEFVFTPSGEQLVDWGELRADDAVVVPAFGTTLEMQEQLASRGIDPYTYNTTCPFVEKVWKRSSELGEKGFTVVVHGKAAHEETRATFSHSAREAPTVVVRDVAEAKVLAEAIVGNLAPGDFDHRFGRKCSAGFDPDRDLCRIGVVNQTTMLASQTREIARVLRAALASRYGEERITEHFADTSDTLCYATNENQDATYALIERGADLALVVGGYNSSNTSHIVELCRAAMHTYFIKGEEEILSAERIRHFSPESRRVEETAPWLPEKRPVEVVLTCGASCPDSILEGVMMRVSALFEGSRDPGVVLREYLDG